MSVDLIIFFRRRGTLSLCVWQDTATPKWKICKGKLNSGWFVKAFTYKLTFWVSWRKVV